MIILINSTIYTAGEPFARFRSNLAAALWLRSIGARLAERRGSRMMFKL
jgi:hypothetical protein